MFMHWTDESGTWAVRDIGAKLSIVGEGDTAFAVLTILGSNPSRHVLSIGELEALAAMTAEATAEAQRRGAGS